MQTGILVQINWEKLASYAFIIRIADDLLCLYCKKLVDVYEKYPVDLELYVTSRLSSFPMLGEGKEDKLQDEKADIKVWVPLELSFNKLLIPVAFWHLLHKER